MAKDTYYFKHDCNARNDIKILKLRRELGMEGYGIFFALIEILRDQSEYKLPLENIEDIAYELRVDADKVNKTIRNYGLFTIENDTFYSPSLMVRMAEYNELKNKRIEAGKAGRQKQLNGQTLGNAQAKPEQVDGQTPAEPQALDYTTLNNTTLNDTKPTKADKKENKEEKPLTLPFNSVSFIEEWDKWKLYKKEQFKFTFKGSISEQTALNQLNSISNGNEQTAIHIINQSIARGYKGLFYSEPPQPQQTPYPRPNQQQPFPFDQERGRTYNH